jgi:hypothetical protein
MSYNQKILTNIHNFPQTKKMYGVALKNGAGGDGKQEYFCKVPYVSLFYCKRSSLSLKSLFLQKSTSRLAVSFFFVILFNAFWRYCESVVCVDDINIEVLC